MLALAHGVWGIGGAVLAINDQSVRQAATPDSLQGRVNATCHVLLISTFPIGAVLGGLLAEVVGLRTTLLVGGLGTVLSTGWLVFSPVRSLREPPTPAPEPLQAG